MSNYNFGNLNDKEFETLVMDLLSKSLNKRIERFKKGRDLGIDGRFYSTDTKATIIQCKHWKETDVNKLMYNLKAVEAKKVEKLNPAEYIFVTSKPLSPAHKKTIFEIFKPFIKNQSYVLGEDDINALLSEHKDIEKSHYKLWFTSTNVLQTIFNAAIVGRSLEKTDEIIRNSRHYVVTKNHHDAIKMIEKNRSLIISGEPGSGKSTLADQICLNLLAKDYELVMLSNDIREAEAVYDPDKKQVFYYDDFLGRNYLLAILNHEDSTIINFIKRIERTQNKYFILTSRTNIINQASILSDLYKQSNHVKNKHEIRVDRITKYEKANILYNHLWHGKLTPEYIDKIYENKKYNQVVSHRNFNPRLIAFLVDYERVSSIPHGHYWDYIIGILNNPEDVWENLFDSQIDENCRNLVRLVVFCGTKISEADLRTAYENLKHRMGITQINQFNSEFHAVSKFMVGALLNRTMDLNTNQVTFDIFNPSIGDFVIKRSANSKIVFDLLVSLQSIESLKNFRSLKFNQIITADHYENVMDNLFNYVFSSSNINSFKYSFVIFIGSESIRDLNNTAECDSIRSYISDNMQNSLLSPLDLTADLLNNMFEIQDTAELREVSTIFLKHKPVTLDSEEINSLVQLAESIDEDLYNEIHDFYIDRVSDDYKENLQRLIYEQEVFTKEDSGGIANNHQEVQRALSDMLSDYRALNFSKDQISDISEHCDLDEIEQTMTERKFESDHFDDYYDDDPGDRPISEQEKIDDLFEK